MCLGQYPGQPPLGAECSGVVTRVGNRVERFSVGDHVLVMAADSFRSFLLVDQNRAMTIPQELPLNEAATLPVAYLTASIALEDIGQMKRGDRVLIHAATGGVGLAAIQLATSVGAEIFATASVSKQDTLRKMGINHVFDSRRDRICRADSQRHVETGCRPDSEFTRTGVHRRKRTCSCRSGRYLDITMAQRVSEHPELSSRGDLHYQAIHLAQMLQDQPDLIESKLGPLVQRVVDKHLQPLPSRCFDLTDAKTAFRHMRSAQHVGKILLCPTHRVARPAEPAAAIERAPGDDSTPIVRGDRSYLITGGLGGLGLVVARWLAQQGAGHIGLLARRRPTDKELSAIGEIVASGVAVETLRADVELQEEVTAALASFRHTAPPLGGVFHLAGRLDDGQILRQSAEKFANVLGPKARGAWNLHNATLCDELDHFVLFSSVSSVLGSAGQANHAAANAFLDGLAGYRRASGATGADHQLGPLVRNRCRCKTRCGQPSGSHGNRHDYA